MKLRIKNSKSDLGRAVAVVITIATIVCGVANAATAQERSRLPPNILVIVADDLGYSDLGSFGGEIDTPNLDQLARSGLRFSAFYSAPTCSPSRAMLLSGVDAHTAGLGNMAEDVAPNQRGKDGYEGFLSRRVASVAELLHDAGYATLMAGKWHLGLEASQSPAARGFEKSFALLPGGGSHFDMSGTTTVSPISSYRDDGKLIKHLPKGFYSSDYYTDRMIEYLRSVRSGQAAFAYLAFTAPHWPLQAPAELIKKYEDRYRAGPALLRQLRLSGLVREKLLEPNTVPHGFDPPAPDWEGLKPQVRNVEALKMAIFAAMVDRLDWNVGRIIGELKRLGRLDNTYVIFLSDNGAEGHDLAVFPEFRDFARRFDNRISNIGHRGSFVWYGPHWAEAATAPAHLFKGYPTEGGIHVPAFIWGPRVKSGRGLTAALTSVMDITPTILELAGVNPPSATFHGRAVARLEGRSLVKLLEGQAGTIRSNQDTLGWELFGRSAIRQGAWKALRLARPVDHGVWELFNVDADPAESNNLAATNSTKLNEMIALWNLYAAEHGVVIPDTISGY